MNEKRKMKTGKKIIIGLVAFIFIVASAFFIYVSDYYRADNIAIEAAIMSSDIDITKENGALVFNPGNAETALNFYPGGKVEYSAYEPLMIEIAQKGILCILPRMPFNLAVLNVNVADDYIADYPEILHWYMGGHSLGGSMAARYASKNMDKVEGLVLLASYSTSNLSTSSMRVISIYGSKDGVLNTESYQKNKVNLPESLIEFVLEGGNHAGFGSYGEQKGDEKADITSEQQQTDTAQAIADFLLYRVP